MFLAPNCRAQSDLLPGGNHALAGMPFILNAIGVYSGPMQGLSQFVQVGLLNTLPVTQGGNKLVLEKNYVCLSGHVISSDRPKLPAW